ncbi:MAG: hypothetical protein LBP59_02370 [Planctomycetaceae bacterium]|jgi:hypothetical protein|nr:hypothetical protein [Planctomycetaceae bacterium]
MFNNCFFARYAQIQRTNFSRIFVVIFVTLFLFNIFPIDPIQQICVATTTGGKNTTSQITGKISPLINDTTFFVAHINFAEIDLKLLRKQMMKLTNQTLADHIFGVHLVDEKSKKNVIDEAEKLFDEIFPALETILDDLVVKSGISDLYFAGALINLEDESGKRLEPVFYAAIPHNLNDKSNKNIAAIPKIENILKFIAKNIGLAETNIIIKNNLLIYPLLTDNKNDDLSKLDNDLKIINDKFTVIKNKNLNNNENNQANQNIDEQFKNYIINFSATKNLYLDAAFKSCEDDLIQVVFLFGKPFKKYLPQIASLLNHNEQLTNIIQFITGQINYLSISADPAKLRFRAIAKAKSAASAKHVQNGLSGIIDLGVTFANSSASAVIMFAGLKERTSDLISFPLEILRGLANFAVPVCDNDNLKWNYEINPEKILGEYVFVIIVFSCITAMTFENEYEELFDKWKTEIRPLLQSQISQLQNNNK